VEYKIADNIEDMLHAINEGEAHIAAAGLTRTEAREQKYVFGPDYKTVQQQVVCHRRSKLPKDINDLLNRTILVIAESSYQEALQEQQQNYPELTWQATSDLSTEQVLEKLVNKEVDCTVVDSNIL
jgi:membrane-bound lytic murein transglycosylase F